MFTGDISKVGAIIMDYYKDYIKALIKTNDIPNGYNEKMVMVP